jgi:hypothetical protein
MAKIAILTLCAPSDKSKLTELQWNFKPRTILKSLFWPNPRELLGPKFESHTLFYEIFLQKSGTLLVWTFYGPELAGPGFSVSL